MATEAIPIIFARSQTVELAGEWELSLDPEGAVGPEQLSVDLRSELFVKVLGAGVILAVVAFIFIFW